MRQILATALLTICLATGACAADVRLEQYLHPKKEGVRTLNRVFLDGVKSGLIMYSVAMGEHGGPPTFCLPPNLALTVEQADDILVRWANTHHPAAPQ